MLILAIFAGREKISKIVSRISTTFPWLARLPFLQSSSGNLYRRRDLPPAGKVLEPHPNVFAFPLAQALLLRASLSQQNYSSGDCRRSIAFPEL
jgi:hypothetical protein